MRRLNDSSIKRIISVLSVSIESEERERIKLSIGFFRKKNSILSLFHVYVNNYSAVRV